MATVNVGGNLNVRASKNLTGVDHLGDWFIRVLNVWTGSYSLVVVSVVKETCLGGSLGSVCGLIYPLVMARAWTQSAEKAGLPEFLLLPAGALHNQEDPLTSWNPWSHTVRSNWGSDQV